MNRIQAEALIGTEVYAWTAMNGCYTGVLKGVSGRPWRGTIEVTGIIQPAFHMDNGVPARRGFRSGETIEVGGKSIKTLGGVTVYLSYRDALMDALRQQHDSFITMSDYSRNGEGGRVTKSLIHCLEVIIETEKQQELTGEWKINRSAGDASRQQAIASRFRC